MPGVWRRIIVMVINHGVRAHTGLKHTCPDLAKHSYSNAVDRKQPVGCVRDGVFGAIQHRGRLSTEASQLPRVVDGKVRVAVGLLD